MLLLQHVCKRRGTKPEKGGGVRRREYLFLNGIDLQLQVRENLSDLVQVFVGGCRDVEKTDLMLDFLLRESHKDGFSVIIKQR